MPSELHIVDPPENISDEQLHSYDPGSMFRWLELDISDRECWCIVLPNKAGLWWTTYKAGGNGNLWTITGIPPKITVHPSINAGDGSEPGNWHGYITNGIMVP